MKAWRKRYLPGEEEVFEVEAAMLRLGARLALAPALLRADATHLELSMRHLEGAFPSEPDLPAVTALGRALARLHALEVPAAVAHRVIPRSAIAFARDASALAHALGRHHALPAGQRATVRAWGRAIDGPLRAFVAPQERLLRDAPLAPCHGDVKAANLFLHAGRVRFIDFEGARVADPAWELACTSLAFDFTPEAEDALLAAWSRGRTDGATVATRMATWRLVALVHWPLDALLRRVQGRREPSGTARLLARARVALEAVSGRRLGRLEGLASVDRQT